MSLPLVTKPAPHLASLSADISIPIHTLFLAQWCLASQCTWTSAKPLLPGSVWTSGLWPPSLLPADASSSWATQPPLLLRMLIWWSALPPSGMHPLWMSTNPTASGSASSTWPGSVHLGMMFVFYAVMYFRIFWTDPKWGPQGNPPVLSFNVKT